jgi:processive 1,2-diacylglycerol beta-glucosyltransferase
MLENPFVEKQLGGFTRLQAMLEKILNETQPDCVVSTYPVYGHVIKKIFAGHERPFKFITIVTDSITINSSWFRAPSDYFCVANDASADVLIKGGVAEKNIQTLGFPVNPIFADNPDTLPQPAGNEPRRVLYIINTGKKKAGKVIDRLLEFQERPTDHHRRARRGVEGQAHRAHPRLYKDRVKVLGWTNQMPQFLMSHHLVISKAGGATVQEAIAARCPMIINQVIPGQEEGNAQLITRI